MTLSNFDDLLLAARAQPVPQRLLFVFAGVELPDDSTQKQRDDFAAGQGGALVPLMFVDKSADELEDFGALARESLQMGQDWRIVFAAAMPGRGALAPSGADAEPVLHRMVESIRQGRHAEYMPFDRQGDPVIFG